MYAQFLLSENIFIAQHIRIVVFIVLHLKSPETGITLNNHNFLLSLIHTSQYSNNL